MKPMEAQAGLLLWAARNTVHNLKFIPEDRLAWKPAPTAKSALEIVQHVTGAINSMLPVLDGAEWSFPETPLPASLEEAEAMLLEAAERYAGALKEVRGDQLGRPVSIAGRFTFPLARAANMPVVDLIHHHGQIAYLQTLLGDEEMHFVEDAS